MLYPDIIHRLSSPQTDFTSAEVEAFIEALLDGHFTLSQIGGLLTALHLRGSSAAVLTGATRVMLRRCRHINPSRRPLVDIFGVGPADSATDYVVPAASLVIAAAGCPVARAAGASLDNAAGVEIAKALGLNPHSPRPVVEESIVKLSFGLMFEPDMHPALHQFVPVRRDLAIRTLFDEITPLANPANPEGRLALVPGQARAEIYATVLRGVGTQLGYVIGGADGLNKATPHAPCHVVQFEVDSQHSFTFDALEYGFARASLADIKRIGTAGELAKLTRRLLQGKEPGPAEDTVVLNAGFALHAAGARDELAGCFDLARDTMHSGRANHLLDEVIKLYATGLSAEVK